MLSHSQHIHLVLLAGGSGSRMRSAIPKQFLEISNGRTLFEETLVRLCHTTKFRSAVVTFPSDNMQKGSHLASDIIEAGTILTTVVGGETRQESSAIAIDALQGEPDDIVLIHDAARPFVTNQLIDRLIRAASSVGVAIPVVSSQDSLVKIKDGLVTEYLYRDELRRVQTPQAFRLRIIQQAHQTARQESITNACDDASLASFAGFAIAIVDGEIANLKITTPEDLAIARSLLQDLESN